MKASFLHQLPVWLMCAVVAAPLLMLLQTWWYIDQAIWQHLWHTQLLELLGNTLILLVGVGFGVAFLGVSLAWLTANCAFPGQRFFDWALILPLAIPAYVLAFVTLGIYDFGSWLQTSMRALGYPGFFDARHPLMVVWVMSAVLYPYVYLLVRTSFLSQGTHFIDTARTLGRTPTQAFFEVSLPAIRPALVAGMSLALMEALADFGAVSIFGFNTFTTAIYKSWISLFSLQTAAQLSSLLLLFVFLCLFGERISRKGLRQGRTHIQKKQRLVLKGARAWGASCYCALILFLTVLAPIAQLLFWVIPEIGSALNTDFIQLVGRTFALGILAACLVLIFAILVASSSRQKVLATEFAGLGYALPGSVLAIGIMLTLGGLDVLLVGWFQAQPLLLGSLAGLLIAYLVRFFRPGYGAVKTGFASIHQNHLDASAIMGVTGLQRFRRLSLPIILPGVLTAALLVFVDVIKEMPATLLLRPFGWDTLAVKLYELTSEGEWKRAALPALALVLVSLFPVALLIKRSQMSVFVFRNRGSSSG